MNILMQLRKQNFISPLLITLKKSSVQHPGAEGRNNFSIGNKGKLIQANYWAIMKTSILHKPDIDMSDNISSLS